MRTSLTLLCMVVLLCAAEPAQAQFRTDTPDQPAPARVYDDSQFKAALDKVFSPEHFQMGHSYEMSYSAFGGQSLSMGMYTNTLQWQFDKVAARVDVSMAQPFSGGEAFFGQDQGPRLFLRNAEIAYRPTENMMLHVQVRQSPYGGYLSPYGSPYGRSMYGASYGGYGYAPYGGRSFNVRMGTAPDRLFDDGASR